MQNTTSDLVYTSNKLSSIFVKGVKDFSMNPNSYRTLYSLLMKIKSQIHTFQFKEDKLTNAIIHNNLSIHSLTDKIK